MTVEIVPRIAELDAAEWNRLNSGNYPFLSHEFLHAAEATGCVAAANGWQPCHLVIRNKAGQLDAAMPLYEKIHSFGEFVFDWAWARAFEQAGYAYYPKLVSAAPFTPAGSPRLLCTPAAAATAPAALLAGALSLATERGLSSLHVQFPHADELPALRSAGLQLRKDCQFHWHNRGYGSFDEFLQQFSARKRKKARRDRRSVEEQGIRFRRLSGGQIDRDLWQDIYQLISRTFFLRGSAPYLNLDFFLAFAERLPARILVILAERESHPVAAAVFFVGDDTLYGRYWGSNGHYDALHFETCYYQGIAYCIDNGLQRFEPGTQGEHKISRGFTPVTTWSAHWLAHSQFFDAVSDYLQQEHAHVDRYMEAVAAHSPYRKNPDQESG
jgi:uncharacterized protein